MTYAGRNGSSTKERSEESQESPLVAPVFPFILPTQGKCDAYARAEWDRPTLIIAHTPGDEADLSNDFFPANLSQGPASYVEAALEHELFLSIIRNYLPGVPIIDPIKFITDTARHNQHYYDVLRKEAAKVLEFDVTGISDSQKQGYALRCGEWSLDCKTVEELIHTLMSRPKHYCRDDRNSHTGYSQRTEIDALSNLMFCRDQQFVTDKGIIAGSMNSPQRSGEGRLTKIVFDILGINHMVSITTPIEGGDFIPAGDVAFQGVGARTKMESVRMALEHGGYGYDEIAVVIDPYQKQEEMHLDTYFNVCAPGKCVVLEDRITPGHLKETYVLLFKKTENGQYVAAGRKEINEIHRGQTLRRNEIGDPLFPLRDYLTARGFTIIPVTKEEQQAYAINFLTIGDGMVIGTDIQAKEDLKWRFRSRNIQPLDFPMLDYRKLDRDFQLKMEKNKICYIPVRLNNLNLYYGSAHCLTLVFRDRGANGGGG